MCLLGTEEKSDEGNGNITTEVNKLETPIPSPFHLPSGPIYNIFHPSDPIAYRIEPLFLPLNTPSSQIPAPCYLLPGGINTARLHIKAKEIGDTIYETFSGI